MKTEKQSVIRQDNENPAPETLAVNLEKELREGKAKLFSTAEMWNLRKNFRSASDRRRSGN